MRAPQPLQIPESFPNPAVISQHLFQRTKPTVCSRRTFLPSDERKSITQLRFKLLPNHPLCVCAGKGRWRAICTKYTSKEIATGYNDNLCAKGRGTVTEDVLIYKGRSERDSDACGAMYKGARNRTANPVVVSRKDRSKQSPKEPEIRERTFIENIRTSVQYANREGGVKCEDVERKTKE